MKIKEIILNNFRIYKGKNEIKFDIISNKNINIIAGRNGFGKTTFLTSLIWGFYGKMMAEVEEKYKKDIKNAGGYEKFLKTLVNRELYSEFENGNINNPSFHVEIELTDLSIPSIPCKSVRVKRTYNINHETEHLEIFIDGLENELTKEVGLDVFINDFILPREIAKFFFFDAEKIVSLAEAKSKSELRNLSKAYSEVLGIKKYEDLKKNLETLLSKLRRNGASPLQQEKLKNLVEEESEIFELTEINRDKLLKIEVHLAELKSNSDSIQEKLIREGNGISLEELQKLKLEHQKFKEQSSEIRNRLKKLLDIVPIVMAGSKLKELFEQLKSEHYSNNHQFEQFINNSDFNSFINLFSNKIQHFNIDKTYKNQIIEALKSSALENQSSNIFNNGKILLDYSEEQYRNIESLIDYIKNSFSTQFNAIIQEEKNNKIYSSKVYHQIKQAEARKNNPIAKKLREDKIEIDNEIIKLNIQKGKLIEESENYNRRLTSLRKVISELEKQFKLIESDEKKFKVTEELLNRINKLISKIKIEKKYSLQKSIMLGLKKIMHKDDFIYNVNVNVIDDLIDIDLLDKNDQIIDKDLLSKGEQQLYATALLKALVDESGIKFPVFIDSPLQKFDKYHSKNIIKEFYPAISEQVVLFPLLEKELSEIEYDYLSEYVNKVFMIENKDNNSKFKPIVNKDLFQHIKQEENVYSN